MRTSFLQDLYLQRPITLTILIGVISVLPWIGLGDFATKGEPREAAVAVSMIETGNYILPEAYANEFAYKPPLAHWLMAVFSLPQGYVSEATARLPSAIALIALITMTLIFFAKRIHKFQEALITVLLLATCVEIHRAGLTTRVDMVLTALTVAGLFQLYRWEEKMELKGLPVFIPLILGAATLAKGFVGVILPLFVFGVYLLMLRKYRLPAIIKAVAYVFISSLFLPVLWYLAAWKQGGDDFLNLVVAENFGRFFHFELESTTYNLGHENNVWYNFQTLILGFIPWTLLALFSLFGMKWKRPEMPFKALVADCWNRICNMDKVRLFSLVALVCIIFFYSIPLSKRSVYLMPAYPFISLFIAQFFTNLAECRTKVTRVFAGFLATVTLTVLLLVLLAAAKIIDPVAIIGQYTGRESTLRTVEIVTGLLQSPDWITLFVLGFLLAALGILFYQLFRKINIKILYATFGLVFMVNILIDGIIMRSIKNGTSSRPFAEQIMREYAFTEKNIFVMNYPREYSNLYGLNFYMGNRFNNFEQEMPDSGYFIAGDRNMEKIEEKYGDKYTFRKLTSTPYAVDEIKQKIVLYDFVRK